MMIERDPGSVEIGDIKLPPRRLGLIRLNPEIMLALWKEDMPLARVRFDGVPPDTHLVDFGRDDTCFVMIVESERFAEVPPHGPVPEITVTIAYEHMRLMPKSDAVN